MIKFVKAHKLGVAIACAAILLCAAIAANAVSTHYTEPVAELVTELVPPGRIHDAGVFGEDIVVHDSNEGEIVIAASPRAEAINDVPENDAHDSAQITDPTLMPSIAPVLVAADPEAIWTEDTFAGNHTLVEKALMQDGSIGVLTIPRLMLSVNV